MSSHQDQTDSPLARSPLVLKARCVQPFHQRLQTVRLNTARTITPSNLGDGIVSIDRMDVSTIEKVSKQQDLKLASHHSAEKGKDGSEGKTTNDDRQEGATEQTGGLITPPPNAKEIKRRVQALINGFQEPDLEREDDFTRMG